MSFSLNITHGTKNCVEVLVHVFLCLLLALVFSPRVATLWHKTSMEKDDKKTRCPLCEFQVWNWHLKRHMKIHDTSSTKNPHVLLDISPSNADYARMPHHPDPHEFQESASFSWDTPSCNSDDTEEDKEVSNSEDEDDDSDGTNVSDDPSDMFGDQTDITVASYITSLSDKYDPKRVLKYLSWSPRPLTILEQESIRFLRRLSFGAGLSRAHSQEWLDYARDLGGVVSCSIIWFFYALLRVRVYRNTFPAPHIMLSRSIVITYTFQMYIFIVHLQSTFFPYILNVHKKCTLLMYISFVHCYCTFFYV
jgi:hypothetical protein